MKAMILPTMYIYIYLCICIIFNIHIYIYTNVCYLLSWVFFHVGKNFFSSRISLKTKVRMVEIAILTMGPFKDELPWRLPWRTSTGLRCLRWQRRKGGKNWCPLYMEKSLSIKKKYKYIYILIKTYVYIYVRYIIDVVFFNFLLSCYALEDQHGTYKSHV